MGMGDFHMNNFAIYGVIRHPTGVDTVCNSIQTASNLADAKSLWYMGSEWLFAHGFENLRMVKGKKVSKGYSLTANGVPDF